MSAVRPIDADALRTQLAHVEIAASKLIKRLADRAAYARDEEFDEIRGLISALRKLGGQA